MSLPPSSAAIERALENAPTRQALELLFNIVDPAEDKGTLPRVHEGQGLFTFDLTRKQFDELFDKLRKTDRRFRALRADARKAQRLLKDMSTGIIRLRLDPETPEEMETAKEFIRTLKEEAVYPGFTLTTKSSENYINNIGKDIKSRLPESIAEPVQPNDEQSDSFGVNVVSTKLGNGSVRLDNTSVSTSRSGSDGSEKTLTSAVSSSGVSDNRTNNSGSSNRDNNNNQPPSVKPTTVNEDNNNNNNAKEEKVKQEQDNEESYSYEFEEEEEDSEYQAEDGEIVIKRLNVVPKCKPSIISSVDVTEKQTKDKTRKSRPNSVPGREFEQKSQVEVKVYDEESEREKRKHKKRKSASRSQRRSINNNNAPKMSALERFKEADDHFEGLQCHSPNEYNSNPQQRGDERQQHVQFKSDYYTQPVENHIGMTVNLKVMPYPRKDPFGDVSSSELYGISSRKSFKGSKLDQSKCVIM